MHLSGLPPHLGLLIDMERASSDHRHRRRQHLECPSRRLENVAEGGSEEPLPSSSLPLLLRPPETPTETMEFLARSWSLSASEVSRALGGGDVVLPPPPPSLEKLPFAAATSHENFATQTDKRTAEPFGHSPPISPRGYGELKLLRGVPRGKTMVGWLRDIKEKRKEETRAHNARVYAATSVAGVAAAVAGIAAGTVFAPPRASMLPFDGASRTSAAAASAAALVASHCIEMARAMGATRGQILAVIRSAVNAQTTGDIMALTAGAATALRGAATLRARLCKDICGEEAITAGSLESKGSPSAASFVSKGGELLKRTRKGDLHWKQVSISMNSNWQVVLKMRSTYIARTFAKTKKRAWPGREAGDSSNQRAYFGIRTQERLIEFECRNKYEKETWADGLRQILDCQANMNIAATMQIEIRLGWIQIRLTRLNYFMNKFPSTYMVCNCLLYYSCHSRWNDLSTNGDLRCKVSQAFSFGCVLH